MSDMTPTRRELREAERAMFAKWAEDEQKAKEEFLKQHSEEQKKTQPTVTDLFPFQDDDDDEPVEPLAPFAFPVAPLPAPDVTLPSEVSGKKNSPEIRKNVSLLTVISLLAGVASGAFSFVPQLTIAALPLGGLAVIMAVIALILPGYRRLLPAAALLVSLVATGYTGYHQFLAPPPAPVAHVAAPISYTVQVTGDAAQATKIVLTYGAKSTVKPVTIAGPKLPFSRVVTIPAGATVTVAATSATTGKSITCAVLSKGVTLDTKTAKGPGATVTCVAPTLSATASPSPAASK